MDTEQCTEITSNSTPLRQGDILLFKSKCESEKYGIVITGDCDIIQNKCRQIISYCTITTVKYYISTELLYDICISSEISKVEKNITKTVCKMLRAQESNTFLSTLLGRDNSDIKNLLNNNEKLVNKILQLKEIKSKMEFSLDDYKKLFKMNTDSDLGEEKITKVKDKILSKLNSLPGDKYYITEIPNQNDNFGYIVHLRLINTISQKEIENQTDLYRIGHLEAPYLYRLTQKLGAVFSDIGEPQLFEDSRTEINKMLCKEL